MTNELTGMHILPPHVPPLAHVTPLSMTFEAVVLSTIYLEVLVALVLTAIVVFELIMGWFVMVSTFLIRFGFLHL